MNPNTFIKNKGITQTYTYNKRHNKLNASEIDWDAEYDGKQANISVNLQHSDGDKQHYDIKLDNHDLAQILSMPSINTPIDKRLLDDFKPRKKNKYINMNSSYDMPMILIPKQPNTYKNMSSPNIYPTIQSKLVLPLDIDNNNIRHHTKTKRQHSKKLGGTKKSKKNRYRQH
jgi:hypothetical protein